MTEPFVKVYGPLDAVGKAVARKTNRPGADLEMAAIGLEAECALWIDDKPTTPEKVFGDPRAFLGDGLVHREGTSYHLPTGGAVYFDTGVIEVATPAIEIQYGCAARAGRSLWESLHAVRDGLDGRERRRFDACIDAMLGRRLIYQNVCSGIHFPFLPADEFFDDRHFPWFAELSAGTIPLLAGLADGSLSPEDAVIVIC